MDPFHLTPLSKDELGPETIRVGDEEFDSIRSGDPSLQLWSAAGVALPGSQAFLLLMICFFMIWPVSYSMFTRYFNIGSIRSDEVFSILLCLVMPTIVISLGSLDGQDIFAYIKSFSLMALAAAFIFFKYHSRDTPGFRRACTVIMFTFLGINIMEAVVFELKEFGLNYYNIANAVAGFLNTIGVVVIGYRFGAWIRNEGPDRIHMNLNLTPLWVVAYTVWNLAYMASYFPQQAALYGSVSLLVPLFLAFVIKADWLESRVHTLLIISVFSTLVGGLNGAFVATHGLLQDMFLSETYRASMSFTGLALNIFMLFKLFN